MDHAPKRDAKGHYLPGQTGNPGGLAKRFSTLWLQKLEENHSLEQAADIIATMVASTEFWMDPRFSHLQGKILDRFLPQVIEVEHTLPQSDRITLAQQLEALARQAIDGSEAPALGSGLGGNGQSHSGAAGKLEPVGEG